MLFTVVISLSWPDFFFMMDPNFEGVRPEKRLFSPALKGDREVPY